MSDVINFLERMGRDAQFRHASQDEVELVLASEQIDPDLQAAILAKNPSQLETLLGLGVFCCMQEPGKEDEDEDDDSEESPSHEISGKASQLGRRAAIAVA